jgi:hypothetical protein
MKVDYLRGNATASAIGLFVICRHLSKYDEARKPETLRKDLQPLLSQQKGAGDVMEASLAIGSGLGVLQEAPGAGWSVAPELRDPLKNVELDAWAWFRGELLLRINRQAMAAIAAKEPVSDLALGMAWFLQLNPLTPLPTSWGDGAEDVLKSLGLKAIERSEQWRPFMRWSIALGLARNVDSGKSAVCLPDASTAIADQFHALPGSAHAQEWLNLLTKRLPIFGSPALLAELPQRRAGWLEVPPALSLGLLKLEKSGAITMEPSDDAADIINVGLGMSGRQVGSITVTGANV